ncbi:MAG: phosphoglucosamine mutase [Bacteroidales bacterium]|nr:phosphoglucosamine mutase [Bacteroidales bacterium]
MTLIKSISGIRGTIGGACGENLTPVDIAKFTAAYARGKRKVVVGRDSRLSGRMVEHIVCGTLMACGCKVIDIGLASTPTTEMAVLEEKADGGIIITSSHNPRQWNALKLLNSRGEFLSNEEGNEVVDLATREDISFSEVDHLGSVTHRDYTQHHIDAVLNIPIVNKEAIRNAHFRVVLDPINSVGSLIMPALLNQLGVECIIINGDPTGDFVHNPEPLPLHLKDLCATVKRENADLGISVDPDVDRLAFISEDGSYFGEEYTLVAVADYVLGKEKGSTVSNISSSRALRDITEAHGCHYEAAAVGEVNVTTTMHAIGAVIGGEGNGGIIFPALHYGRDAVVGTALFLSLLAEKKMKVSQIRATYPDYFMSKQRIEIPDMAKAPIILDGIRKLYKDYRLTLIDGIRIDFEEERKWVILRKSNTEPIIRVYAEAPTQEKADILAHEIIAAAANLL